MKWIDQQSVVLLILPMLTASVLPGFGSVYERKVLQVHGAGSLIMFLIFGFSPNAQVLFEWGPLFVCFYSIIVGVYLLFSAGETVRAEFMNAVICSMSLTALKSSLLLYLAVFFLWAGILYSLRQNKSRVRTE